jgi:hypothetical protein
MMTGRKGLSLVEHSPWEEALNDLLNEMSDLNSAWFDGGFAVGRGKSKRINIFKNYDRDRNEEEWKILLGRLKELEKEKPVGLDKEIESRRWVAKKPKERVNPYAAMPDDPLLEIEEGGG